jgi:hypothetical protein
MKASKALIILIFHATLKYITITVSLENKKIKVEAISYPSKAKTKNTCIIAGNLIDTSRFCLI